MFETFYRCLYWRLNEEELCGIAPERYARYERAMNYLVARIGYVPAT